MHDGLGDDENVIDAFATTGGSDAFKLIRPWIEKIIRSLENQAPATIALFQMRTQQRLMDWMVGFSDDLDEIVQAVVQRAEMDVEQARGANLRYAVRVELGTGQNRLMTFSLGTTIDPVRDGFSLRHDLVDSPTAVGLTAQSQRHAEAGFALGLHGARIGVQVLERETHSLRGRVRELEEQLAEQNRFMFELRMLDSVIKQDTRRWELEEQRKSERDAMVKQMLPLVAGQLLKGRMPALPGFAPPGFQPGQPAQPGTDPPPPGGPPAAESREPAGPPMPEGAVPVPRDLLDILVRTSITVDSIVASLEKDPRKIDTLRKTLDPHDLPAFMELLETTHARRAWEARRGGGGRTTPEPRPAQAAPSTRSTPSTNGGVANGASPKNGHAPQAPTAGFGFRPSTE